jgi:5'-nucleotidase
MGAHRHSSSFSLQDAFRMTRLARLTLPVASILASILSSILLASCATPGPQAPIEVNLVAINDFHGHLEAENFTYASVRDGKEHEVHAGGIAALGAALQAWRREDDQLLFIGAGDLVGASPALSGAWADEPTIEALNLMGLRLSALGNHELDQGRNELLRQQNGGCQSSRPEAACKFRPGFSGAKYAYLAANVVDSATGKPFLPAYRIEEAHGVKIGFIGAVLRDTVAMVQASGVKGLSFLDETESINRWVPELKARGVNAIVVLIHEGGETSEYPDQPDCTRLRGPIVDIAKRLDPAIRLIVSGHTHKGYLCRVDGRFVTQAEQYGHFLTRMTLLIDPATHAIADVKARNEVIDTAARAPDPELAALLNDVKERSRQALERPVARIAVPKVPRKENDAGESALGDLVADAELASVRKFGAQIAFVNNKGLRADLQTVDVDGAHVPNVSQVAVIHPFNNRMVLMTLTGEQIRALLEQQMWLDAEAPDGRNVLQVSHGFTYAWDASRPLGQRVVPGSIRLDGKPLDDKTAYRVVANNFLAEGGDRVPMFKDGSDRIDTGIKDRDALMDYLMAQERAGHPAGSAESAGRIRRVK